MAKSKFKPKIKRYAGTDSTNVRMSFFIFCEGEKTEVNYFNGLNRKYRNINMYVAGGGCGTFKLIEKAIAQKKIQENNSSEKFDYCWVVFDKDNFPNDDFEASIKLAKTKKFNSAWSNISFELWYLLHFNYENTPVSVKYCKDKLTELLKREYKKNDSDTCVCLIKDDYIKIAINNAEKLEDANKGKQPCNCNPGTMVHKLVRQILDEDEKYSKTTVT